MRQAGKIWPEPAPMNNPRKILIVALDNLGDAVIATALFKPIRDLFPGVQIGFFVKEYVAGLFSNLPNYFRLHAADPFWDKSPVKGKGSLLNFLRTFNEVRKENYDSALVLNAEWRRSALCFLAGIPRRFGMGRRKAGFFLNYVQFPPAGKQHFLEDNLDLLGLLSGRAIHPGEVFPEISLSLTERQKGEKWRSALKWEKNPVAMIHLLTKKRERSFPLSKWAESIKVLSAMNPDLRFAILCEEKDKPEIGPFLKLFREGLIEMVIGGLGDIKAFMSQSSVFIGGDSGPGHLAAALGIPVVSLFGPTDPDRFRPIGRNLVKVLKHDPLKDMPVEKVGAVVDFCFQVARERISKT